MTEGRIVKPLAVFIVVLVAILGGTFLLAVVNPGSSGPPDGQSIDGQSPSQYQPDAVNAPVDPEEGQISVDAEARGQRILVDTSHGNQVSESELEPITEAVFEAGHTVEYGTAGTASFADSLGQYDGVLIVQPLGSYSEEERDALQEYTDDGGRVVVLAEPTQTRLSTGFTQSTTTVSFGANNATERYGVRMGSEQLYNVDDAANDNNFKAIYASPSGDGELTDGVETITFDTAGYAVVNGDAETKFTAADGTRTLETRRTGTYATVVRNDNMVFVTDSTFIRSSEIYDADNEVFIGNLLSFLLDGEAPDPGGAASTDPGFGAGGDTSTPAGTPAESTPSPTPTPAPTPSGS
ncbi:DUF4350 domain-containing protein [Haloarcula sp. Atlit-120R]|uniref:DUF4350 domain-containing protein n=1 Tax=Haloarcula sp. Atlit-120R TaxID=2282135 RepID=UPI000EF21F19|nr:DUF4350 domain-containing protein [Haloarcula sp. Atlit-120R]RLM39622.1 hypothetical protein DVK01_03415 [Haloarcula sp. Atlit-120R]